MNELTTLSCEVCNAGIQGSNRDEIDDFMLQLPGWEIIQVKGINRIRRSFSFANFKEALSFTERLGCIADEESHYPAILTEWGKVTVTWWTQKVKGLHANDFIMAAKTDVEYLSPLR
ncbi:MAG TPA: 4a-hydroxytetrahydrobiopterin dehydratase [Verrucomicrobia bacterium]|nr:MAG: 4a-hydroxytetrahydrobiopterin dehydratase [Lentisphaerae bacterium GWF2_57_35]HBA84233.1 4a-hydroxytetrahydrobiopterin dehydratase [Verrucomicrobiota bacterium]